MPFKSSLQNRFNNYIVHACPHAKKKKNTFRFSAEVDAHADREWRLGVVSETYCMFDFHAYTFVCACACGLWTACTWIPGITRVVIRILLCFDFLFNTQEMTTPIRFHFSDGNLNGVSSL